MQIIIDIFAPLLDAIEDRDGMKVLLADLGWELELTDAQATALADAMALPTHIQAIATVAQSFIETRELTAEQVETLLQKAQAIFAIIQGYADGSTLDDLAGVPEPFNSFSTDWQAMAVRLPDYLITSWLHAGYAPIYESLHAFGLIQETDQLDADGLLDSRLPAWRAIRWDLLETALTDPIGQLATHYAWHDSFDVGLAFTNLNRVLISLGLYPPYRPMRPELVADWMNGHTGPEAVEIEAVLLDQRARFGAGARAEARVSLVLGTLGSDQGLTGVALTNMLRGSVADRQELADGIFLALSAAGEADRALDFRVRPSGLELIAGDDEADIRVALEGKKDEGAWRLIGAEGKAGMELAQFTVSATTTLSTKGDHDLEFAATTAGLEPGLRIIIAPGDGDGFIAEIFGDLEFAITGDIGARWSLKDGFRFDAGVGFDVLISIDQTLSPIGIDSLRLKMLADLGGVTIDAAVTGGLDIAVMQVVVEEIGVRAILAAVPADEQPGNIGPLDLQLKFLPPKGMGLSVKAGDLVTGGGYLFHDAEAGEYAGVGQISFTAFKLTAIGMLSTRLPDNQPGWSLFLSVFSEFPPIQLAFGITLNGIGGLMGLHRTFDDEALRDRLRDGALEPIMFPPDPIANAPQILSDIRAIFPVSQGQFVFGVMVRLGWGTPRLITADIGVIVEFPDPIKIALLGRIAIVIPDPTAAVVELNMDVFGVVNLTEKTFKLDATLGGHVLHLFQLSGDMAMRMSWGDQPNMLISMGGFHPDFVPPEGTPTLARLHAALPLGDNAAVELTAYTAITSNTFQAGGRLDVWVRVSGFNAEGWFSFDALIQFDPFGFEFRVTFGVSVSKGETTLMGVDVVAVVTGPGLWVVDGTAKFKFLGVKKSINVYVTVGREQPAPPVFTDVAVLIRDALLSPEALEILLPDEATLPVILVEREDATATVVPSATLQLWQKVAPFGTELEKYGTGGVEGQDFFAFDMLALGATPAAPVEEAMLLEEWFSPAAFEEMTDDEKLRRPSYQLFPAGVSVGSTAVTTGAEAELIHDFETITLDPELNERRKPGTEASAPGFGPRSGVDDILGPGSFKRASRRRRGTRGVLNRARLMAGQPAAPSPAPAPQFNLKPSPLRTGRP